ncbi:alpha-ketoglutarate-dependent dioxygenase AlkB [Natronospirillum operosum]|uniref:Alpha-ketoglutarate-dependent dioxygenase AlkB n=1 Tax=Natronospirillum operosum TaxID=2759953 RepID=A0A4Z0WII8_9GAMM|nr:alpha-ketoglutarate-dependent dioxygenase AlkB [Natronospirillum operosum]TGG94945.1 alpha-ketoglutarate-dependent dioxygenase AlkB [Natronospirillum operosum]
MVNSVPDCDFTADYLTATEADNLLAHCLTALPWQQEDILLFGRTVAQPRLQVWMGEPDAVYRYSGTDFVPVPWDAQIRALCTRLARDCGTRFNSVLCNLYQHGQHSMGWHADDEPELGPEPVIASLSLGHARRFVLRPRAKGNPDRHEWSLGHGDLLVMRGQTQQHWLHGIPKTRRAVGPRVNLTFRRLLGAEVSAGRAESAEIDVG